MPKSLRVKLGGLRYKGILADKDYKRLCKALDNEDVLDKIRAEIFKEVINYSGTGEEVIQAYADGLKKGLDIIDKYRTGSEDAEC